MLLAVAKKKNRGSKVEGVSQCCCELGTVIFLEPPRTPVSHIPWTAKEGKRKEQKKENLARKGDPINSLDGLEFLPPPFSFLRKLVLPPFCNYVVGGRERIRLVGSKRE